MSNFIPDEKIEEVKNAADIVEVISDYVLLKKTGLNYSGLCPFHSEKYPSFTVSPTKQIFHCFGCNTGGNVFTFLMKREGLSFPEVVKTLARRYGISLPEKKLSQAMQKKIEEKEHLFAVNRLATTFYRQVLLKSSQGHAARNYIRQRGFSRAVVENFQLGYAPRSWNSMLNLLLKKNIPLELIEKSGLVVAQKNKSGFYDRFRDRIIFPIVNLSNQVIGFGGRVLDDSLPKYLNSPETPVYNKRRSLYGLHRAKDRCRQTRSVFIVEGYFDLLALHQHGIENSAATLGTALTPEHIQLLKGFAEKIFLVFDADDAGIQASLRGVGIFIRAGVDARVVLLPEGHDPDSYLAAFGSNAFHKQAEISLGIMPFLMTAAEKKYGSSVDGKLKVANELTPYLATIQEDARSLYIKELSERLSIDEYIILDKVRNEAASLAKNSEKRAASQRGPEGVAAGNVDGYGQVEKRSVKTEIGSRLERQVLSMMIQFPEILPDVIESNVLEHFSSETLKALGSTILKHVTQSDGQLSNLMSVVDDDEKRNILASLALKEEMWNAKDCRKVITKLVQKSPMRYSLSLNEQIKAAERENNQSLLLKLLRKKQELAVSTEKQKMKLSNHMN